MNILQTGELNTLNTLNYNNTLKQDTNLASSTVKNSEVQPAYDVNISEAALKLQATSVSEVRKKEAFSTQEELMEYFRTKYEDIDFAVISHETAINLHTHPSMITNKDGTLKRSIIAIDQDSVDKFMKMSPREFVKTEKHIMNAFLQNRESDGDPNARNYYTGVISTYGSIQTGPSDIKLDVSFNDKRSIRKRESRILVDVTTADGKNNNLGGVVAINDKGKDAREKEIMDFLNNKYKNLEFNIASNEAIFDAYTNLKTFVGEEAGTKKSQVVIDQVAMDKIRDLDMNEISKLMDKYVSYFSTNEEQNFNYDYKNNGVKPSNMTRVITSITSNKDGYFSTDIDAASSQSYNNISFTPTENTKIEPPVTATTNATEEPTNPVIANVTEEPTNQVIANVTEEPTNQVIANVTEEPTNQVIANVTEEPTNQVIANVTEEPTNQAINNATKEPINPAILANDLNNSKENKSFGDSFYKSDQNYNDQLKLHQTIDKLAGGYLGANKGIYNNNFFDILNPTKESGNILDSIYVYNEKENKNAINFNEINKFALENNYFTKQLESIAKAYSLY